MSNNASSTASGTSGSTANNSANSEAITSVFNDGYIAEVYEAFRQNPSSVDESWRQFFRFAEQLAGKAAIHGRTVKMADDQIGPLGARCAHDLPQITHVQ